MDADVLSKEYLIAACACESVVIKTDRRMDKQTDADVVSPPVAGWVFI